MLEHGPGATTDGGGDIVHIGKDDVGALATKLQRNTLYRVSGVFRHSHAATGRAGEGHHVHIWMAGERRSDNRALAIDQIEDARRHTRFMQDLGIEHRRQRGEFGRLQDHGAAGGERRGNLEHHLVHRPVPRRDETANPDGFLQDHIAIAGRFEFELLQRLDEALQMADADDGLRFLRQRARCAHLCGDRFCHLVIAGLVDRKNALQQLDPLGLAGLRIGRKRGIGSLDRPVGIRSTAHRDDRDHLLGRRVDDVQIRG